MYSSISKTNLHTGHSMADVEKPKYTRRLERSLDLKMVTSISIGAMLGSGIFVLPGLAAAKTGTSVWLAYVVAGICVLPAALSKSELATAMPTSGGTYVYLERAFGPLIGTVSGLGLWLSLILKSAFALMGFGTYLSIIANVPEVPTALVLLGIITTVNLFGAVKVGQVQVAIVGLSIFTLSFYAFLGFLQLESSTPPPFLIAGGTGFFSAVAFVFVAFAGVTKIAAISEEVKNPSRNIPAGMLISLSIVTAVYATVVYIIVHLIPEAVLYTDLHPVATLGEILLGHAGAVAAAILGILTMTSMANSGILASSRFPFAMSRDDLLPPLFQRVSERFRTPVNSIVVTGLTMALIISFLDLDKIVKLASSFIIMMFIGVNVAVIVLRQTGVQWYKPEWRSPMYPWIQIFGIFSGSFLITELGVTSLWAFLMVSIPGSLLYLFYGTSNTGRQGVLRLYRRRASVRFFSGIGKNRRDRSTDSARSEEVKSVLPPSARSPVVLPLLGKEHSPEMLVELSSAILGSNWIDVVYISEVPEQAILQTTPAEELLLRSLERRMSAMSLAESAAINFETVLTHDRLHTLQSINKDDSVKWMVMEWDGNAGSGLVFDTPVGWVVHNLSCNLALIKDAGVRYIRAILVYFKPGPDQELVMDTVNRLAVLYQATVTFVSVVPATAPEADHDLARDNLACYAEQCEAKHTIRILRANNRIQAVTNLSAGYDLLVTGSPKQARFGKWVFGMKRDQLTEQAACSVLRLRTPRSSITS